MSEAMKLWMAESSIVAGELCESSTFALVPALTPYSLPVVASQFDVGMKAPSASSNARFVSSAYVIVTSSGVARTGPPFGVTTGRLCGASENGPPASGSSRASLGPSAPASCTAGPASGGVVRTSAALIESVPPSAIACAPLTPPQAAAPRTATSSAIAFRIERVDTRCPG